MFLGLRAARGVGSIHIHISLKIIHFFKPDESGLIKA